ncbi:MAG: hypothetical protein KDC38_12665, partial [Planctomycetes bacterium]|nr:hypothetical protein [Planctomycetota bacterium]
MHHAADRSHEDEVVARSPLHDERKIVTELPDDDLFIGERVEEVPLPTAEVPLGRVRDPIRHQALDLGGAGGRL